MRVIDLLNPMSAEEELQRSHHHHHRQIQLTLNQEDSDLEGSDEMDHQDTENLTSHGSSSGSSSSSGSRSPSPFDPKSTSSSSSYKEERVVSKVWKVCRFFKARKSEEEEAEEGADRRLVSELTVGYLSSVSEMRLRKKTINQLTGAVAFHVLKHLGSPVTLQEVVRALKALDKSDSISRSSKITYSHNHADVLGISKLASILSYAPPAARTPTPIPTASTPTTTGGMEDLVLSLCEKMEAGEEVTRVASELTRFGEHPTLGSRHKASVAAACILHAVKMTGSGLTLAKLATAVNVAPSTIRKAALAIAQLA